MLVDDNSQTFHKPNTAIVMVPRVGRLTAIARKLYNVMLQRTQQQIAVLVAEGKPLDARHLFSSPLSRLMASISAGESDARAIAKQYLKEMRRVEVDWEAPDAKTGVVWRSMSLLSEVEIEIRAGQTWVHWALPPTLLMAVADPLRYTPLDLEEMSKLQTYTAIALYEICCRYRNNPTGLTSRNAPEWWVDALTGSGTGGNKPKREWRKLKSASVLKAVDEINTKTALNIQLIEIKEGRAVSAVQFSVQKNKKLGSTKKQLGQDLLEAGSRCGVAFDTLSKLVSERQSEQVVLIALYRLEQRQKQTELTPIENTGAYLRSILLELEDQITTETPPVADIEHASPNQNKPLVVQNDLLEHTAQPPSDYTLAKETLSQMTIEDRQVYLDAAAKQLQGSGLCTPAVLRKFKERDWTSPLLQAFTIKAYLHEAQAATIQ